MPLDVPRMLACCAAFGDVDGAQELNLTLCVLILLYICPHTTICVLILQSAAHARSAECGQTCLLILPHLCPHTTMCVPTLLHMCPPATTYLASSYYYLCVLIHMCPHTAVGGACFAECGQTNRRLCHTGTLQPMLLPICM
jgi:hypothetical protein